MPQPYKDIENYGIIGNLETCCLIGRDGSIEWLCFPFLESPSVFAAILDVHPGPDIAWAVSRAPAGEGWSRTVRSRPPMLSGEILELFEGLCGAVASIHAQRAVCGNLKPSNVFLTPDGLKLLDFGIARATETVAERTQAELTQPGVVLGTPQ